MKITISEATKAELSRIAGTVLAHDKDVLRKNVERARVKRGLCPDCASYAPKGICRNCGVVFSPSAPYYQ
jgi:hypothetical protein